MELFSEQIIGLRQVFYNKKDDGSEILSKFKVFIFLCFVFSHVFIFVGFSFLPESEKTRCHDIGTNYCYKGKEFPISDPNRFNDLLEKELNPFATLNNTEQAELDVYNLIILRYEELKEFHENGLNSTEQAELDAFQADLKANEKLNDPILVILGANILNGLIIFVAFKYALNYHNHTVRSLFRKMLIFPGKKKYPIYFFYFLVIIYLLLLIINLPKFLDNILPVILADNMNIPLEDIQIFVLFLPFMIISVFLLIGPIILISEGLVNIWFLLGSFFLLNGVIVLIHIMTAEIKTEGYGRSNLVFLLTNLIFISGFTLFLAKFIGQPQINNENLISFMGINLFIPALVIIQDVFFGMIIIGLSYILIWRFKDFRNTVVSKRREEKKAVLSWILILTFIVVILRFLPVAIGAGGSIRRITDILDVLGMFFIIAIGIGRILHLRDAEVIDDTRSRLNPQRIIEWFPAYSRLLFLFSIGISIFYRIIQGSTIAGITGDPDPFKIERMNNFFGAFGFILVLILIIWRYKAPDYTITPALLTDIAVRLHLIRDPRKN